MKARWYWIIGITLMLGIVSMLTIYFIHKHRLSIETASSKNTTSEAKSNRSIQFTKS
jgi:uncharacterized membrane protein YedE/YeeE